MDNIDWWAVLNAPGNEQQLQPGQQRHDRAQQLSVANLTQGYGQESPPAHVIASLYPPHGQPDQGRANPSPTPPNSAFSQSSIDSWPQRQDSQVQNTHADLLSYLSHQSSSSETHPYLPNLVTPSSNQVLSHPTPQQGDTAFQGLPDWLFPPAISPQQAPAQARSFPTVPPPPPWALYHPPHAQPEERSTYDPGGYQHGEPRSQSARDQSRASSPSLTPNISHRSSPGPSNISARFSAHSPTQLQEVTSAELNGLGSNGSSARPQPSRSASSNGGIEPEDAEDKRSRNTQASARFRAKKKQQSQSLQRGIDELESRHAELERDVHDLRRENGFLKDMVMLKWGNGATAAAGVDSLPTAAAATPASPSKGRDELIHDEE